MAGFSNNFVGLWSKAEHKIKAFSLQNQRFALGVSGGADSIGLFHVFLSFLKQKIISDLVVFHINFGLRGDESDGDEDFVRGICQSNQVRFAVFHAALEKGSGVQERAREFRLQIQSDYVQNGFIIALAHNADDLAETILMRLARGSSPENAAGMSFFRNHIFRPWLEVSRQDIRDSLRERGIAWRDDSSNETEIYCRNAIRHTVIPALEALFPGARQRIGSSFLAAYAGKSADDWSKEAFIPMTVMADVAKEALCGKVYDFLNAQYGGRSPVPRSVLAQIAASIHKISSGLDGEGRVFQLPGNKNLTLSRSEMRLVDRN